MLIKPITYVNYNGEKKTKNFYFNLSRTELTKMELLEKAGMEGKIKAMIDTDNREEFVKLFESIVLGAYGEKSADGEEFMKSPELVEKFKHHPAYDVLFMELLSGGDKAMSEFLNAIIPQDVAEDIKKSPQKTLDDVMGYKVLPGPGSAGSEA
jgi:hypothetical protein